MCLICSLWTFSISTSTYFNDMYDNGDLNVKARLKVIKFRREL